MQLTWEEQLTEHMLSAAQGATDTATSTSFCCSCPLSESGPRKPRASASARSPTAERLPARPTPADVCRRWPRSASGSTTRMSTVTSFRSAGRACGLQKMMFKHVRKDRTASRHHAAHNATQVVPMQADVSSISPSLSAHDQTLGLTVQKQHTWSLPEGLPLAVDSMPRKGPAARPSAAPPLGCLLKMFFRSGCGNGPRSWMLPFKPVRRQQNHSSFRLLGIVGLQELPSADSGLQKIGT